jgi:phosphatidylinositol alpha 1,6-mannosyltransferase
VLREHRSDLVHLIQPSLFSLQAYRAARSLDLPVVATEDPGRGTSDGLLGRLLQRCDLTWSSSTEGARRLRARGVPAAAAWPIGVDSRRFNPAYRSLELRATAGAANHPLVLYAGRLDGCKSLTTLTTAAAMLRERGHRFRLAFLGRGPLRAELRERFPEAIFPGFQRGERLARWYASADVFVAPEAGLGHALLEAAASGLPLIAGDGMVARDLVTPEVSGMLVEPDNRYDLAFQLQRMLVDASLRDRLRAGAMRTARERPWSAAAETLVPVYYRVAAERAPWSHARSVSRGAASPAEVLTGHH